MTPSYASSTNGSAPSPNSLDIQLDGGSDDEIRLNLKKVASNSPPAVPKRSTSCDFLRPNNEHQLQRAAEAPLLQPKLSPPTPFADDLDSVFMPHIMSATTSRPEPFRGCKTMPRKLRPQLIAEAIPPPPQYKGVHFDPHIKVERQSSSASEAEADPIPVEGLPTRPARLLQGFETVAIQVRKANPVPLLASVKANPQSSFDPLGGKKQPPRPPPKTSCLLSKAGQGVKAKAMAASAAGCEIVFVSPDEGFNEEEAECSK